jgi:histidyl-tRNA synthetase
MRRHRRVVEAACAASERYGYLEMSTPIFEFSEVFKRTLGDTSDIVTKEMYTFTDKGGEQLTLRPENTAGVARAFISGGLSQHLPLKYFYAGPMFRYERPQKGRFRQFHQIGVELLGVATPQADIEVIALGQRILKELGIADRVVLEINTLGDPESRAAYRKALVGYFSGRRAELSEDSRRRLDTNPLRILDSKDPADMRINADAPTFDTYLNDASYEFFGRVRDGLARLGIAYRHNPRLVRGLDYYTHTAFEFVTTDLGAQGTVMGGGRYDGLVELMGGPAMAGVGWAAGIERLAMLIAEPPVPWRPVALVPIGDEADVFALRLAEDLRDHGLVVELGYSGNLARRMRRADRVGARAAVLLGDDELARNAATVRDLDSGAQSEIALDALPAHLKAMYG